RVELFLNFTTPLPGSAVFTIAVQRGLVEAPRQFSDWGRFDYIHPNIMNIDPAYEERVHRFMRYLSLAFPGASTSSLHRMLRLPLRPTARWRLDQQMFDYPIELAAENAARAIHRVIGG